MLHSASFCQQAATMSTYKFTPRAVASPDAPQKPLVRKRARSGVAEWVQVARHRPGSQAKKPRTAGSQQPASRHEDHHILSTAEAASFASQFWDCRVHPAKASQHEFLATCIDVDLEKNVQHAQWHKYTRKEGGNNEDDSDSEQSVVPRALLRLVHCPICSSGCSKM